MSAPFHAKACIVIKIRLFLFSHLVRYHNIKIAITLVIMRKNVQLQMYTSVDYVAKANLLKGNYGGKCPGGKCPATLLKIEHH